jgi:hypothetical protein
MAARLEILPVKLEMLLNAGFDCLTELWLVVFEADHEIATAIDDITSDLFPAAHGIDRDQRVCKFDLLQSLGNRCDHVGFLLGRYLAQGDPFLMAHALAMCNGPSGGDALWDRQHVLSSMAISRSGPLSSF